MKCLNTAPNMGQSRLLGAPRQTLRESEGLVGLRRALVEDEVSGCQVLEAAIIPHRPFDVSGAKTPLWRCWPRKTCRQSSRISVNLSPNLED